MALPDALSATGDAWHRIDEDVLASARYALTSHIGRCPPATGGFATPPFGLEPTVLAVNLDELVVNRAGQQRRTRTPPCALTGRRPGYWPPGTSSGRGRWLLSQPRRPTMTRHGRGAAVAGAIRPGHHGRAGQLRRLRATRTSNPTCTSVHSTAPRLAVTNSGTPRSARYLYRKVSSVDAAVASFHTGRDCARVPQKSTS